jgi:hypothetical protein
MLHAAKAEDAVGKFADNIAAAFHDDHFKTIVMVENRARIGVSVDAFLIDRSNEQVCIPDDGTFEFAGPNRSYGHEGKFSVRLMRYLALNGGLTQVTQSFCRRTSPRFRRQCAAQRGGCGSDVVGMAWMCCIAAMATRGKLPTGWIGRNDSGLRA